MEAAPLLEILCISIAAFHKLQHEERLIWYSLLGIPNSSETRPADVAAVREVVH